MNLHAPDIFEEAARAAALITDVADVSGGTASWLKSGGVVTVDAAATPGARWVTHANMQAAFRQSVTAPVNRAAAVIYYNTGQSMRDVHGALW